jgi:hypothetical protein
MTKNPWQKEFTPYPSNRFYRHVGRFILVVEYYLGGTGWWAKVLLKNTLENTTIHTKNQIPSQEEAQAVCEQIVRELAQEALDGLNE